MMIHPPMLYSGYVAFTVPFAFAIGALVTRRIDADWIRATRRFALIAWALLGFGLLLGARWSYTELGWGGYWAWDPVENAALMPWLIGTAFLHSIMVQEKRGMLKVWNACLIVATFSLALLGTFLVRSGVLQSIHAFGDSTVGPYILGLIAVVLIGSTALIVSRLDDLRSEKRIDSLISRESVFLINNLLLVALTVAIFWGTFFPLISELFTGEKASLAAPWFDRYTTPLAILLVLFTGIGPLLAWRRVSWASAKRVFLVPAAVGVAVGGRAGARHRRRPTPLGAAPLRLRRLLPDRARAGVLARGGGAAQALRRLAAVGAWSAMVSRNRRRYGGYIVHAGVAVLLVGIAASSSFQTNRDVTLKPGESADDRRPHGHLREADRQRRQARRSRFGALLTVVHGRQDLLPASRTPLLPADRRRDLDDRQLLRRRGDQRGGAEGRAPAATSGSPSTPTSPASRARSASADKGFEACIGGAPGSPPECKAVAGLMRAAAANPSLQPPRSARSTACRRRPRRGSPKTYIAEGTPATFRVIVDPLVTWIWIGGLIALTGAGIALWPARRPRGALVGADPELEALKEAKYREIRDAELDHAAGKLSDEDFALLDAELRKEAVEILDRGNGSPGGARAGRKVRAGAGSDLQQDRAC